MKKLKLGIICDEFFDLKIGRMGGFGWAAQSVARFFKECPELGVDVVFLSNELCEENGRTELVVHDTRLLLRRRNRISQVRSLLAERLDLLLSVDYNTGYRWMFLALPRTPIIVWVRNPLTPEDMKRMDTLRIPSAQHIRPQGIAPLDCTSMRAVVQLSRWFARPVFFATTTPYLASKIASTFGTKKPQVFTLANIISLDPGATVVKSAQPRVVFLARLDPYKRPWLFCALAEQFPEAEFLMLGKAHFDGESGWQPDNLPSNVRLMGHVGEDEKLKLLSSAWVLVNTSIHEGLAVSFLEALACETPIISCQDPEGIVSRYGICVGRHDGTGVESLPQFVAGLKRLLSDERLRVSLGKSGRKWVNDTHNRARFLCAFREMCQKAGLTAEMN